MYADRVGMSSCLLCAAGTSLDGSYLAGYPAVAAVACSGSCGCSPSSGQSSGTITDGYGDLQYYCDGEDCRWLISSSREIRLSFTFFSTESGYDYVTINRCTSSSCNSTEQIARLSGLVSSSNVYTSSTGYLQVLFISASASPGLILMDKLYVFVWENHLDPVYMENSITHKMISAIGSSSVSSISSLSTLISRLSDIPAPQFVVITWQEQVSIVLGLTSQEKDSLLAYVNSGGKLVVDYVGSPWSRSLLNCVFGWSLTGIGCSDTQKVSGTATCDFGHTSLPQVSGFYCLKTSSLPASATVYYETPQKERNFSRQVKHFLGCKKSTKSNTCGSLFTCSCALLFFIDENCKITEPMHFWTWVLLRAFCTTFRRKRFIART